MIYVKVKDKYFCRRNVKMLSENCFFSQFHSRYNYQEGTKSKYEHAYLDPLITPYTTPRILLKR